MYGIRDVDVADAPTLAEVLPQLLDVTAGKTVLAYNADFDCATIARHGHRDGLNAGHLADRDRWACLMHRRTDWALRRRWLPLGGGHRGVGDAPCL